VRRGQRIAEQEADPELAVYRMRTTKRYAEDGTLVITIRGTPRTARSSLLVSMPSRQTSNGAAQPTQTTPRKRQPPKGHRVYGSSKIPRNRRRRA
jgi:hypothetical protein